MRKKLPLCIVPLVCAGLTVVLFCLQYLMLIDHENLSYVLVNDRVWSDGQDVYAISNQSGLFGSRGVLYRNGEKIYSQDADFYAVTGNSHSIYLASDKVVIELAKNGAETARYSTPQGFLLAADDQYLFVYSISPGACRMFYKAVEDKAFINVDELAWEMQDDPAARRFADGYFELRIGDWSVAAALLNADADGRQFHYALYNRRQNAPAMTDAYMEWLNAVHEDQLTIVGSAPQMGLEWRTFGKQTAFSDAHQLREKEKGATYRVAMLPGGMAVESKWVGIGSENAQTHRSDTLWRFSPKDQQPQKVYETQKAQRIVGFTDGWAVVVDENDRSAVCRNLESGKELVMKRLPKDVFTIQSAGGYLFAYAMGGTLVYSEPLVYCDGGVS